MKRTKVLFLITKSNWGGAQKYVFDLAISLSTERYDVVVAAGGEGELIHKLQANNIRTISIPFLERDVSIRKELSAAKYIFDIFRREQPDVVHLNSSKAGGLGGLLARLTMIPHIVFTLHGLAVNEERSWLQKQLILASYFVIIMLSDLTIAVSERLGREARWIYPFGKKIRVIKNGIAVPQFLERDEARRILELPQHAFVIGALGELHPIKGHTYLLQGFKRFLETLPEQNRENYFLAIIGEGEERDSLESEITRLELAESVRLCGHIGNAATYLKAFDIFAFPSLSEGLGYVAIEAGFAGLPVIASHVGGIPEIITDNETGLLIPARNPEAICVAFQKLVADENLRNTLAANLKHKVESEFTLEKMVEETEKLYH